MAVIGGDVKEITFNHPVIGSGVLFPKSGEDTTLDPGGYKSKDDNASVDAAGRNIRILNNSRWNFSTVISWDSVNSKELDKLDKMSASPIDATFTFQFANGSVFAGTGAPVGDINGSVSGATTALKLAGGGKCEQIA